MTAVPLDFSYANIRSIIPVDRGLFEQVDQDALGILVEQHGTEAGFKVGDIVILTEGMIGGDPETGEGAMNLVLQDRVAIAIDYWVPNKQITEAMSSRDLFRAVAAVADRAVRESIV